MVNEIKKNLDTIPGLEMAIFHLTSKAVVFTVDCQISAKRNYLIG